MQARRVTGASALVELSPAFDGIHAHVTQPVSIRKIRHVRTIFFFLSIHHGIVPTE